MARIDGSTGWCVCLLGVGGSFGKYLCDEAAEKIFTAPQVITGGTIYPPGKAVVQDGGYIISGRWPYASGCHHCDWLAAACHVFEMARGDWLARFPNCVGSTYRVRT